MDFDQKLWAALATKISTTSAMNPAMFLVAVTCPISLLGSIGLFYAKLMIPAAIVLAVGLIPIAVTCWQIVFFTKNDPDRLQREEHNQRMFELRSALTIKENDQIREVPISGQLTDNPLLQDQSGE